MPVEFLCFKPLIPWPRSTVWSRAGLGLALSLALPGFAQERVVVNCAEPADPPLVRKFGVANSCAVPMERYRRDAGALTALKPASLRVELGWGFSKVGWSKPLITGSAGNVQYAWGELDELARLCSDQGVDLSLAYCYTPSVLERDSWYSPPASIRQWAGAAKEYAYHFRTAGQPIVAHEVWNRSDSTIYYNASRGTYFRLFKDTVGALREADPEAVVGGPVIAGQGEWVTPFLNYVAFDKIPLDFFSFLAVAPGEGDQTWGPVQKRLADVRKALAEAPALGTTEVRLTAFNPLPRAQMRPQAGVAQPALAAEMLSYLEQFLLQTDLTAVNWSQFMDSGITNDAQGLLDLAGEPRPAFGALALYADMPVDRVAAAAPAPLRVLASRNATQASALVWNPGPEKRSVIIEFQKLPFSAGGLGVHRIDGQNSVKFLRTGGWAIQPADTRPTAGEGAEWQGEIPPLGVVYLRAEATVANAATTPLPTVRVARLHRWFRDRYSSAYADFERATLTARLGMGAETRATAMIGASLGNCPTNLQARVELSGNPRKQDTGTTLAVRVDVYDRAACSTSALFHTGLYDVARTETPPWGTRRPPDKVVALPAGEIWDLDLGALVPPGWGNRAIVTFYLRDAGVGARAKFSLTSSAK